MARQILRFLLIGLLGASILTGCFPRMPTNQAAQQPASTDASFSPDGSKILFAANHDGDLEIYVVNADGTDQRQLTENSKQDFFPSWSPDGETIVFSSDRTGAVELYLMDTDGGNQRPLIAGDR
jgi:Tol biopolymer transport system component